MDIIDSEERVFGKDHSKEMQSLSKQNRDMTEALVTFYDYDSLYIL